MQYSLLALLALALIFPVAFLVLYLRRRHKREARVRDRRRFHDLVEFDRARREEQWAAQPADGIPGLVLQNIVDGQVDPLRHAPPSMFAEVAPGIWQSVRRSSAAAAAAVEQEEPSELELSREAAVAPPLSPSPLPMLPPPMDSQRRSHGEVHAPYGHPATDMGQGSNERIGRRNGSGSGVEVFEGVMGRPVEMENAAAAAGDPKKVVVYGEAAYLSRTPRKELLSQQPSAYSSRGEGEGAVEPVTEVRLHSATADEEEETFEL